MMLGSIKPFCINPKLLGNVERLVWHIVGKGRQECVIHLSILHSLYTEAGAFVCVDGIMGNH